MTLSPLPVAKRKRKFLEEPETQTQAVLAKDNTAKRLFLFDIDGTLLASGGAGKSALRESMRTQFQVEEDFAGILLAGVTDGAIARALLTKQSLPVTPENITRLLDGYIVHLREQMSLHPGSLCPGILELLELLHSRSDCVLGLLTGNINRGAEIKLKHYGVWHYFEFGAFGDDHHNRNELGRFAKSRAREAHGIEFPSDLIYVIGDTPKDIDCGRAIGAHTVAIATGDYSSEELHKHKPDFLFEDLRDTKKVIRLLCDN
ncbi:MAG: hydrolase [Verrucomicrobia bacterium]|nr:MAG: hydrolase [Verrucomicrobiota bacterium]